MLNLRLDVVVNDICGLTGLSIITATCKGETLMLDRKLRLMVSEHPELADERKQLRLIIKLYENSNWKDSSKITDQQIKELTGYARWADQRKWFEKRGWPFEVACGGRPIVLRSYVENRLGNSDQLTRKYQPNFDSLRK